MVQEVAVIGASSAGLYAAELLARAGKRVTVFEGTPELRPSSRTYIITSGLERVIPDLDPALVRHRTERFELESGASQVRIGLSTPDLILDRRDLILELARRAEQAGAQLQLDAKFEGWTRKNGKVELHFSSSSAQATVQTDWLIGADGAHSTVRRSLGLEPIQTVPLLQARVKLPDSWDAGMTKVWFDLQKTPYFYWLIPDRDREGVLGLIAEPGADLRQLLEPYLDKLEFEVLSYQSGVASLHARGMRNHHLAEDLPASLVGDAAGQVKVTTVGGTVTGLLGAKAAAEAVISGNPAPPVGLALKKELDLHLFIRELLENMRDQEYDQLIRAVNPAVRAFLSTRDRDGMRRHFWKLAFLQPGFMPLGIRLLLRR